MTMLKADVEDIRRDTAILRAAASPSNNYDLLLDASRHFVRSLPAGVRVVAGQVYKAVIARLPNLVPREKRVMGAVMRALGNENLIRRAGVSTRDRFASWFCPGMATVMSQTPEEIARDIALDVPFAIDIDGTDVEWLSGKIAAAIRSYADERLEWAARNVLGWRECDWPQGFDRFTAETMAQDRAHRIRDLKSSKMIER